MFKNFYPRLLVDYILPVGSFISGTSFSNYLREWGGYDTMTDSELEHLQSDRLRKILEYASSSVPFYKDLHLTNKTQLYSYPVLTKQLLRKHNERLMSEQYSSGQLIKNHSSGSSGLQSVTYTDKKHQFQVLAIQTHWWMWMGYKPGLAVLQTGMSSRRKGLKKWKDLLFRVKYLEAFALNKKKSVKSLNEMRGKSPKFLIGYPSAFYEMGRYALSEEKSYNFDALISLGDKLFEHYLPVFNSAFGNPQILNTYGCAEGLQIGCKLDLPYYYLMSPHVYIEIVDEHNNPVPDGQRGAILVTCLTNFAMPLIRYKLGDMGALLPREEYPASKRFNYPLLKELIGRESDIIKTPMGDSLVVHSFTGILEYYQEIKQYQVVQVATDKIELRYITDNNLPLSAATKQKVLNAINGLHKQSMVVELVRVKEIKASPSGKPEILKVALDDS